MEEDSKDHSTSLFGLRVGANFGVLSRSATINLVPLVEFSQKLEDFNTAIFFELAV